MRMKASHLKTILLLLLLVTAVLSGETLTPEESRILDGLPFIPWENIGLKTDLTYDPNFTETRFSELYSGTLEEKPVFAKATRYGAPAAAREAKLYGRLAEIGVNAPKCRGVSKTPKGEIVVVTDYIPGIDFSLYSLTEQGAGQGVKFTNEMISDVESAFKLLKKNGIEAADVQFRLGFDGRAYLVDPEFLGTSKFPEIGSSPYVEQLQAMLDGLPLTRARPEPS